MSVAQLLAAYGSAASYAHLDPYATGMAGAWSIKRLLSAYSGPAIRVIVGSTETDIGFASDQLDTVALATAAGSGTAYVMTVYDQSGNGNDLKAAGGQRPRIVNAGVYDGAMIFDGVDDVMSSTSGVMSGANLSLVFDYQFRSNAGSTMPLAHSSNINVAGHVTFALQIQPEDDGFMHGYGFNGLLSNGYLENRWSAQSLGSDAIDLFSFVSDASGSSNRGVAYRDGVALTTFGVAAGYFGNFTSERIFLGNNEAGNEATPLNLRTVVAWAANQRVNQAAIYAAIS